MCFIVDPSNRGRIRTATKPITVYKFLEKKVVRGKIRWVSPYWYKQYPIGKVLRVRTLLKGRHSSWVTNQILIERGLHAYTTRAKARAYTASWSDRYPFVAVIPKGAKYRINRDNEVVSTALKIVKPL